MSLAITEARVDVLGVGISIFDLEGVVEAVEEWLAKREQTYVCVTGVHGVMESVRDPQLRRIHNRSGLTTADGMPMVWAGRVAGVPNMKRVYGPDLMVGVLEVACKRGWTSFFYGGRPGTPELLGERLGERFPSIKVVGTYSPPFRQMTPAEDEEVSVAISRARPDLLWVGLSTPKQERWMADHLGRIDTGVMFGVGAAFDVHAGLKKSAPSLLQSMGLEWAYRLAKEPRRLWRRYLRNNPEFVARLVVRRPVLRSWPAAFDSIGGPPSVGL